MAPGELQNASSRLRIRLEALKPLAEDPQRPISFGDLQALLGLSHHQTQRAIRVLGDAQLLDRSYLPGAKPSYSLPTATLKLLTPIQPRRLNRQKVRECFDLALTAAAAHNLSHELSWVTGMAFTGSVMDALVQFHEFIDVEVTVNVRAAGTLVQDLDHLIRNLRRIHDRALRISLVLDLAG
jgi:hypothetical protein